MPVFSYNNALDTARNQHTADVMTYSDNFIKHLSGFELETLDKDASPIFALDRNFRIDYLNSAWFAFARENSGEPDISNRFGIGVYILDAIALPLKDFYLSAYKLTLQSGKPWRHDYECSSATIFRRYHQTIYPFHNRQGVVVVNSLAVERPHDKRKRPDNKADKDTYTQATGFITQCCHCRRVQRADSPSVWDWVPEWVEHMPEETSHSLCYLCFDYYWKLRLMSV
jgi:hypothetical protein